MRAIPNPNFAAVLAVLSAISSPARAQDPAKDPKVLRQQLESKYALTSINAEGVVVEQGATLTLNTSGLTAGGTYACANDYKDGKITLASASKATCGAGGALDKLKNLPYVGGRVPDALRPTRAFVRKENLLRHRDQGRGRDCVFFDIGRHRQRHLQGGDPV